MTASPVLAFDLGGTRLKAGLVSTDPIQVLSQESRPVGRAFAETLDVLVQAGEAVASREDISGAALCVPGLVSDEGKVVALPGKHEGIVGYDLKRFLEERWGRAVVVNDAIAYATGEATAGGGRGFNRVAVMTVGTGVGVTVIEGGRPISSGIHGGGILGGQIPITEDESGRPDTNGRPDTIEALCLAQRIVDYANDAGGSFESVEEVYDSSNSDRSAKTGIERYRSHFTRALTAIAHAHAPEAIVVGGGPMTPGNPILPGLEAEVGKRLFEGYTVQVLTAQLGDSAALAGLAALMPNR